LLAVLNHALGVRRTGRGLGAVDHITTLPASRRSTTSKPQALSIPIAG
jgi:hypothetical protein